jgi:hypothetical protein
MELVMTSDARKKMLDKVKAILSKTMENGCTEEEAMAALAKARELMATYEIDEAELNQFEQEASKLHKTGNSDPYDIKNGLCVPVAKFCRCQGFNGAVNKWGITFVGFESDVIFATWLLDTLQRFIMRALRDFQKQRAVKGIPNSNYTSASFVIGCTARIAEKLKELTVEMPAKNKEVIKVELAKNNIVLHKGRKNSRDLDQKSTEAGYNAGNSARFDRPVGQGGTRRLK